MNSCASGEFEELLCFCVVNSSKKELLQVHGGDGGSSIYISSECLVIRCSFFDDIKQN